MSPDKIKTPYKIGEAAARTALSTATLRLYEQSGLIQPQKTPRGTRLFDDFDVGRIKITHQLAQSGIGLQLLARLSHARPHSKTGDVASKKVLSVLQSLEQQLNSQQQEIARLLDDIRAAQADVQQCRDCTRPPTADGCATCDVMECLHQHSVMQLVLERTP